MSSSIVRLIRRGDDGGRSRLAIAGRQRLLQPVVQTRQRRARVRRDIARHLAEIVHQQTDAIEHPVERPADAIELVAGAGNGNPLRQVAIDDRERGAVDPRETAPGHQADDPGRADASDEHRAGRAGEQPQQRHIHVVDDRAVGRDQQAMTTGQDRGERLRDPAFALAHIGQQFDIRGPSGDLGIQFSGDGGAVRRDRAIVETAGAPRGFVSADRIGDAGWPVIAFVAAMRAKGTDGSSTPPIPPSLEPAWGNYTMSQCAKSRAAGALAVVLALPIIKRIRDQMLSVEAHHRVFPPPRRRSFGDGTEFTPINSLEQSISQGNRRFILAKIIFPYPAVIRWSDTVRPVQGWAMTVIQMGENACKSIFSPCPFPHAF